MVRRNGFTLAEVIVAMTLLSVGTLSVAATALYAARVFTRAAQQEAALQAAEGVLDSLAALSSHDAGGRTVAGVALTWDAFDSTAVLVRMHLPGRPAVDLIAER